jgi:hypothetical protein
MRVALITSFAASRKEPLLAMMDRVHQGFLDAGLAEPFIRFNFGDAQVGGGVSSVDRVLKRHPELARFVTDAPPMPNIAGARRISNGPMSAASGESIPYATLQEIATGVPRSFPFHSVVLHFYAPEFGELLPIPTLAPSAGMMTGILVTDSWWVNGRNRSLSACTVVDAEMNSKKLPPHPAGVATVLAACGKAKKTVQAPMSETPATGPVPGVRLPNSAMVPSADPEKAKAVHEVVLRYRQQLPEIVSRAGLPHDLPAHQVVWQQFGPEINSGPKKPALESVFKPMGYSCRGESGDFVLRRRTATNLAVELSVSIGTWGKSVLVAYRIWGLGFKALLSLPPTEKAVIHGQYPTGDAEHWRKIAENLGALVAELDRTFLAEVESVAGPSPEWYRPQS